MDRSSYRKRNVSDGDSGFESALSSRSSSISLEESQELGKYLDPQIPKVETCVDLQSFLRKQFSCVLAPHEDIVQDVSDPELYLITDKLTGRETLYKPPSKLKFSSEPPQVEETYSSEEYCRSTPIPRSQLFNSRLAYELEKQVDKMELVEVDLVIDPKVVPPPSLGIRVIGVNMIQGIPDKLNIYVKRILEGSLAGNDGRILVNDHIIEVNGTSLVGVGQKLAADTLSSCAINPNTGMVRFVVARERTQPPPALEASSDTQQSSLGSAEPGEDSSNPPPSSEAAQEDRNADDGFVDGHNCATTNPMIDVNNNDTTAEKVAGSEGGDGDGPDGTSLTLDVASPSASAGVVSNLETDTVVDDDWQQPKTFRSLQAIVEGQGDRGGPNAAGLSSGGEFKENPPPTGRRLWSAAPLWMMWRGPLIGVKVGPLANIFSLSMIQRSFLTRRSGGVGLEQNAAARSGDALSGCCQPRHEHVSSTECAWIETYAKAGNGFLTNNCSSRWLIGRIGCRRQADGLLLWQVALVSLYMLAFDVTVGVGGCLVA